MSVNYSSTREGHNTHTLTKPGSGTADGFARRSSRSKGEQTASRRRLDSTRGEVMVTRGCDRVTLQNLSRIYATLYRVTT